MRPLSPDTDPAIERLQLAIMARLPAWRKLALIAGMKVQMDSIQRDTNNQALKLDQLPQLSSQIATLDVRVSDNTRRINELEQVRKLK